MRSDLSVPTLKDVARLAGVSTQTVSCVVNKKGGISKATRARVMQAIEQLQYRPRFVARSLRTRSTRTIAFLVPDIANPSLAAMTSAGEKYAHSFDYNLVVYNSLGDVVRESAYVQMAVDRWVDGVLCVPVKNELTSLDTLEKAGIAAVMIDRIPEKYARPSVIFDNVKAGRIAAEHLLDLGHARIAHISGPLDLRLARERLEGFRQAIIARGLPPGHCVTTDGNWECETGYKAMSNILTCDPLPTGVFAANDRMAIGAMRALYEVGLRVPEDMSIVGLDDIEVAAYQVPPLTTIQQPFAKMATLGVQMLLSLLAGEELANPRIVLEPTLIVRKSSAPPCHN
jgi:DNA-binding LacI/PurR family transcriptional regulator